MASSRKPLANAGLAPVTVSMRMARGSGRTARVWLESIAVNLSCICWCVPRARGSGSIVKSGRGWSNAVIVDLGDYRTVIN
ncbi:hypothetical protein D3C80_1900060 [compost metagenome]